MDPRGATRRRVEHVDLGERCRALGRRGHVDAPVEWTTRRGRHAHHRVDVAFVEPHVRRRELELGTGELRRDIAQGHQLLGARRPRGNRIAGFVAMRRRPRGGEPDAARGETVREQRTHRVDIVLVRHTLGRARAEHRASQRRVPHHEPHVHHRPDLVDTIEELGGGTPVPRHADLQRLERHALDAGEHAHEVVGRVTDERCNRETAVSRHHGGDPVKR